MSIREEIDDARHRLGGSTEPFTEGSENRAQELISTFLSQFTGGVDSRWWWEHFTLPKAARRYEDGKAFTRITRLVPDPHERVWFVAEDDQLPYFPVYEMTSALAQQIIGECYGFEYYLIAKDLSWLLCENHHDVMMAIGSVRPRLESCAP